MLHQIPKIMLGFYIPFGHVSFNNKVSSKYTQISDKIRSGLLLLFGLPIKQNSGILEFRFKLHMWKFTNINHYLEVSNFIRESP